MDVLQTYGGNGTGLSKGKASEQVGREFHFENRNTQVYNANFTEQTSSSYLRS